MCRDLSALLLGDGEPQAAEPDKLHRIEASIFATDHRRLELAGKHEALAKKVSSSVSTLGQRVEELDKLRSQLRVTDERSRELSGRLDKERASWEGLQKQIDEQAKVVSRVVQRLDKLSD